MTVEPVQRRSGRFEKHERRERWRAKQKLVSGLKYVLDLGAGGGRPLPLRKSGDITPGKMLTLYMQNPAI